MFRTCRPAAIAAIGLGALVAPTFAATLPFSTGFEAGEGYANGAQLATNANWIGDGQDTTGWLITNGAVGGSGAASGSQWILASGASNTTTKFQWVVAPVTDFTSNSIIAGSADVKIASPASGTINRTSIAGLQMYDAAVNRIGDISLILDAQNTYGGGANRMLIRLIFGDNTGFLYDLGVNNALNQYLNLGLSVNFQANTVTGYVNGVALPDVGTAGGFTNFHDFDMYLASSTTSAGVRGRGGFDNYQVSHIPTPGTLALLGIGGLAAARRRRA